MRFEPALHFFAACDAVLQLLEGSNARRHGGYLLRRSLHCRGLLAQRLFELWNARLLRFEKAALVTVIAVDLGLFRTQALELAAVRRRQTRLLLAQALLALRELGQDLLRVLAAGL